MTKNEIITQLKADHPTLRTGNEEDGYTELTASEYEAIIDSWADTQLAELQKVTAEQAAKEAAKTKLAALGLTTDDLAALGL